MEDDLHKAVVSQHEAIHAIAKAVRKSRAGLKDPKRPMGSFIFAGPTGVGKTLLAKQLARFMFGDENALVQIDMSEYSEKHNVSRLIGAPPGYIGYEEGGQLTEKIRRRPYSVVLLDEIEKAHPEVWNMLLQIMEEGRLTDNVGRTVDFKNTILIMTTNIGAESIAGRREFGIHAGARRNEEATYENMKLQLKGEMEKNFRPEFLNRVDDVIVFRSLTKAGPGPHHRHRAGEGHEAPEGEEPGAGADRRGQGLPDREGHEPGVRRPPVCAGPSSTTSKTRWRRTCCAARSPARTPSWCGRPATRKTANWCSTPPARRRSW